MIWYLLQMLVEEALFIRGRRLTCLPLRHYLLKLYIGNRIDKITSQNLILRYRKNLRKLSVIIFVI